MREPSQTSHALLTSTPLGPDVALAAAFTAAGLALAWEARRGVMAVAAEQAAAQTLSAEPPLPAVPGAPLVSILVPARNEAPRIGPCLESLLRLDYRPTEILVVDDGSTDGTGAVVARTAGADPRVRLLAAPSLADGWGGKSHALWHGQREARGEWLLFTDADTVHHPASLGAALGRAVAAGAHLLSLTGRQEAVSLAERLVQPFVFEFLARRYPLAAINDPKDALAAANGQYLLIARHLYSAIGGHGAVRGEILEDVALARLAKRHGPILFLAAPDLVRVRMYDGRRELRDGWTKNLADLAGGPAGGAAEGLRLLGRGAAPVVALVLAAVAAAADRDSLSVGLFVLAALGLSAVVVEGRSLARLAGRADSEAWLAPVGVSVTGLLFLWSAFRRSGRRTVTWRGRRYAAARGEACE